MKDFLCCYLYDDSEEIIIKIALFVETYLPYINGVVTHVKCLKDGLEELGHSVMVVTADPKTRKTYLENNVLHCPSKDLKRVYGYGLAWPLSLKRMKYLKDFGPDIIHIHQEFGIGLFGAIAARLLNVPLVYTLHTMYDDYLYYVVPKAVIPFARRVSHRYSRFLASKADALTGPSQKVEEYFREVGVSKSVNVVANPVELETFSRDAVTPKMVQLVRDKYGFSPEDMVVCFCGRMGQEKNINLLLENWKKMISPEENIKLFLLGGGPDLEEFKEYVKTLKIDDMVVFSGEVEHEMLPPFYCLSDMYITASLSDTNSISMKEAMAAGLPVAHIKDELNKGQIVEGVNGFIWETPEEMATVIRSFKEMPPAEKAELRASVVNSVRQFGSTAMAEKLLNIYEKSILQHSRRKAVNAK